MKVKKRLAALALLLDLLRQLMELEGKEKAPALEKKKSYR